MSTTRNKALRAKVFDRDGGRCVNGCGFDPKWQHDHIVDLQFGGADTLENSQTLCRHCHGRKTSEAAPKRAKADRLRERHELMKKRIGG